MPKARKQLVRPILFLDMDDVLCVDSRYSSIQVIDAFNNHGRKNIELWANLINPEARTNLAELHREFFPQYVISSSWSCNINQQQMKDVFERTDLEFIASNLHKDWTTPKGSGSSRVNEITSWITTHKNPKRLILILDDFESGWALKGSSLDNAGMIVFCEKFIGFTTERLLEAQKKLRAQLKL